MKKLISILVLFFIWHNACAQELKAAISYKYLFAKQWDKAIQTYNFARPFVNEKQPLLIHGLNSSVSYIFKSQNYFKHGLNLSHSYFKSSANNENVKNVLNLHFLNLGYLMHYKNSERLTGFYTDVIISATTGGLFRNVNGEPFEYDGSRIKAMGIGGEINLKAGYLIASNENFQISPFVSLGYSPYFYSPNAEAVINQTKTLTSKNWTSILSAQFGLSFHMRK